MIDVSELTIAEMIKQVPEGQGRTFKRSAEDPGEERFFRVWHNHDYGSERMKWLNFRGGGPDAPWPGSRHRARIPLSTLAPPEVRFEGTADEVVDLYATGSDAFLISDKLFRLIEEMDPGSLEHVEFKLRTEDAVLPFHIVMPSRVLEAIDTRRTSVRIEYDDLAGWFMLRVRFPEGIIFNNDALEGVHSFSDLDASGWYWSKDLLEAVKAHGIQGLYANSAASTVNLPVVTL